MTITPLPAFVCRANAEMARAEEALNAPKIRRAIAKHGEAACIKAYRMNKAGEGAHTIALTGPATIKTTRQADAAINAGAAIVEAAKVPA